LLTENPLCALTVDTEARDDNMDKHNGWASHNIPYVCSKLCGEDK